MRRLVWLGCSLALLVQSQSVCAQTPVIHLEVAADAKAPFGAQQAWHDRLKDFELASLRLRQARPRETPRVEKAGTERRPSLRVIAVLDSSNKLRLPGAVFTQRNAGKIPQYLQTLQDEGVDGVTAPRGMFGLTDKQFGEAFDDLSERVGFSTKGKPSRDVADALADRLAHRLVVQPELLGRLDAAEPVGIELREFSRATALAILLRQAGLAFRPQVREGELRYRIEVFQGDLPQAARFRQRNAEEKDSDRKSEDDRLEFWPVGWAPEASPARTAPDLFEQINAQIDGYTLAEAIDAIAPRLATPLVFDRTALAADKINPEHVQVKLAAGKHTYFRILERILHQAHLKGEIRVDERGTPFYWIRPESIGHRSTTNR